MKSKKKVISDTDQLLIRLIELNEKSMIINLYNSGANRNQIKAIVGIGTKKADDVISEIKKLKKA